MPEVPPLRRNREFVALWTGQTAAALGTSISTLAYPLVILAGTGSPALAGLGASVLAATTFLVRLPAGLVADRVDRKRLMLACDAGRFAALASLAAVVALDRLVLWHVLLVVVVEGTLGALFAPAEAAAVRRVVPPSQLREAVARNEARQQLAGLVGPSVGGVLFGLGRALPFAADALSYAVSFVTMTLIHTPLSAGPQPVPRPWRVELLEGFGWLWRQRWLRFVVLWLGAAGVLFTSMGLVTLVRADDLGASAAQIGIMFTMTGAGGLLGALLAPSALQRISPAMIVLAFAWIAPIATLLLLVVDSVWVIGLVGALAFLPAPAVNATVLAEVAARVPDELHGRAVTAVRQLTTLLHPVGPLVAGLALELIGTRPAIAVYGVLLAALAVVATVHRTVRAGPG